MSNLCTDIIQDGNTLEGNSAGISGICSARVVCRLRRALSALPVAAYNRRL